MKNYNLKELNKKELTSIYGGASLAYRIGQTLRYAFLAMGGPAGVAQIGAEIGAN